MKRTEKFESLRRQLKDDLRNPGCVELSNYDEPNPNRNLGKINIPVVVGVGCVATSCFLVGFAIGKAAK